VLSGFAEAEKEIFTEVLDLALKAVKMVLYRGIEVAMNEYNAVDLLAPEPEITEENSDDQHKQLENEENGG